MIATIKCRLTDNRQMPIRSEMILIEDGDYSFNEIATSSDHNGYFYLPNMIIPGHYLLQIFINNQSHSIPIYLRDANSIKEIVVD